MFKTLFALPQLGSELHGHMYAVGGECGLPHDHVKHRRWLAGTHSSRLIYIADICHVRRTTVPRHSALKSEGISDHGL